MVVPSLMSEQFNQHIDELRGQIQSLHQKVLRISQGRAQDRDKISVGNDMTQAEKSLQELKKEYQQILSTIDAPTAKAFDEQVSFIEKKVQDTKKLYKNYQSQQYATFQPEDVNPEEVTIENMQQMQKKKEEDLSQLHKQIKQLGHTNRLIKEELDKGDEKTTELKQSIQHSNTQVVAASAQTKQFTEYLKRNKAPFLLTIIFLIITVLIWSSKAFCSWGFTWQCP